MAFILVMSTLTALASLAALAVLRNGSGYLSPAGVAGLAAVSDLVALVASLLAAAGLFGQQVFHQAHGARPSLWVAAFCAGALVVALARVGLTTRPRQVPTYVEGWRPPRGATAIATLRLCSATPLPGGTRLEVINRAGRLVGLTTALDPDECRSLVGHQVVAMVSGDDPDVVLDLLDLGECEADAPPAPVAGPVGAGLLPAA